MDRDKQITPTNSGVPSEQKDFKKITLSGSLAELNLDLTGLTEEQIQKLKIKHAEVSIENVGRLQQIVSMLRVLNINSTRCPPQLKSRSIGSIYYYYQYT